MELRKGNTKPANAHGMREQSEKEGSVISTIHISTPDEASRVHLSPAVNSSSSPPPLTAPSHRKQAKEALNPTGIAGFLSLSTQLVISAINLLRQASLRSFSGSLCGQTSGLAVIALWVKAERDHTGLVVGQPNTSQ